MQVLKPRLWIFEADDNYRMGVGACILTSDFAAIQLAGACLPACHCGVSGTLT